MTTFNSGNITHRKRKIPIVWDGEHAQHIAEEYVADKNTHPLLHVRIQQLAKNVKKWEKIKKSKKRHQSLIIDSKSKKRFLIIVEIWSKFAFIITCYKK